MCLKPSDPGVVHRMRAAHSHARSAMGVQLSNGAEAWGWHGRTLGKPVAACDSPAWLRVASAQAGQAVDTFWNGAIEAQRSLPRSIPRPQLHSWHDWEDQHWQYRAELYDRLAIRPASPAPVLTKAVDTPTSWWAAMRTMLAEIAAVPTGRFTIHQRFLDYAMPRLLGTPVNTTAPSPWTTAHGDFHFANICAPAFHVLDFEGWGTAPEGYDAATLHTYSLLVPQVGARIRTELAHVLDTPAGRYAELAVITERLHATARGEHPLLAEPLRRRAALLLGRVVPKSERP
jgi:hypothetical protein